MVTPVGTASPNTGHVIMMSAMDRAEPNTVEGEKRLRTGR
jgi:hypothetical protein